MAAIFADAPPAAPFLRMGPESPASPVVLSVPHAGREYSPALLKSARIPLAKLETLEDRLVDRLVWRAVDSGATAIIARAPRAEIDLNRDEREVDPNMVTPPPPARSLVQSSRIRGGLGLIPAQVSGAGSIWLHRISAAELGRRIEAIHRPYHRAVEQALNDARARFGVAILLDCHSMPPRHTPGADASLVFGDRHGTSTSPDYLDAAIEAARQAGFRAALNVPYAGGYITTRHGRPSEGLHALQLEIDRSLYLAADMRSPGKGFDRIAQLIGDIAAALAARTVAPPHAIAAE
jgi:N-formylglutamate amidohydrolase